MKKFLLIIPIFLLLAAGCGSNTQPGQNNTDKSTSKKINLQTLANNDLVGVWQNSPVMAAGWDDRYQFFVSGKYNYRISSMQCSSRDLGHSGYWKIDGRKIQLTKVVEEIIVGGNLKCGPSGGILDGTSQIQKYPGDQTKETIIVDECDKPEVDHYDCLSFNDKDFYKFSEDPTDRNDGGLEKEPQFDNLNNNTMNQNAPDPKMKAAYDGYFKAIETNNYADFIKVIDPEQAKQVDESGFGFLVERAKGGGMLATIQNAKFIEAIDVSARYSIPTLHVYLAEYEHEMEDPLDGIGGPKRGSFTTTVNAMFLIQINGEWKVKSYSTFNYRKAGDAAKDKADFDAELERFLKGIFF